MTNGLKCRAVGVYSHPIRRERRQRLGIRTKLEEIKTKIHTTSSSWL